MDFSSSTSMQPKEIRESILERVQTAHTEIDRLEASFENLGAKIAPVVRDSIEDSEPGMELASTGIQSPLWGDIDRLVRRISSLCNRVYDVSDRVQL